ATVRSRPSSRISARIIWSGGRGRQGPGGNLRRARRKRLARLSRPGLRAGRRAPDHEVQRRIVMRIFGIGVSSACALISFALILTTPVRGGDVPDYFKKILSVESTTPAEVGAKNILQLDTSMFELYGNAGQIFKKNILANHPIILGLFSNTGG